MQTGAFLVRECTQHGFGIEDVSRIDDLCTVCDHGEETEYKPETVEQRRRTAKDVGLCEIHSIANKSRIVYHVAGIIQSARGLNSCRIKVRKSY